MRSGLKTGGVLVLVALLLPTARAQAEGPDPNPMSGPSVPHHDVHVSGIPGLGADEAQDLREGHGMRQAQVAEIQGYPGPRHVLDAWDVGQLSLSYEQSARIQEISRAMAREAQRLGALVLDAERSLGILFQNGGIDPATVRARVQQIAALRGELRVVHLHAHLETRALLDPQQLARYAEVRGYATLGGQPRQGH